jgi:hypothetical protein
MPTTGSSTYSTLLSCPAGLRIAITWPLLSERSYICSLLFHTQGEPPNGTGMVSDAESPASFVAVMLNMPPVRFACAGKTTRHAAANAAANERIHRLDVAMMCFPSCRNGWRRSMQYERNRGLAVGIHHCGGGLMPAGAAGPGSRRLRPSNAVRTSRKCASLDASTHGSARVWQWIRMEDREWIGTGSVHGIAPAGVPAGALCNQFTIV